MMRVTIEASSRVMLDLLTRNAKRGDGAPFVTLTEWRLVKPQHGDDLILRVTGVTNPGGDVVITRTEQPEG